MTQIGSSGEVRRESSGAPAEMPGAGGLRHDGGGPLDDRARATEAERRAMRLQTAAEISRAASSILNLDELLRRSVTLIKERFGLYYAGLFLLDPSGEWAVLCAGTGSAGAEMLAAGHKLRRGGDSMIGGCVADASPRILLHVAAAPGEGPGERRYANPLLPQTRSEMALPLVCRGNVIGAMTIQSEHEGAFTEEDITVLQTMADQLANAIENARLFDQMDGTVRENEVLYNANAQLSEAHTVEEMVWVAGDIAAFIGLNSVSLRVFTHWDQAGVPLTVDIYGLTTRPGTDGTSAPSNTPGLPDTSGAPDASSPLAASSLLEAAARPGVMREAGVPFSYELYEWFFGGGGTTGGTAREHATGARPITARWDLEQDGADVPAAIREPLLRRGHKALVSAPLVARGRRLGVLALFGPDAPRQPGVLPGSPAPRNDRNVQVFVRTLVEQLSSALDRRFLLSELERRASYLATASEISRAATSYLDQGRLLSESVTLIQERFGLYYVGILLLDDSGHWAVLRAGSGLVGRTMVEEGYRLSIDLSSRIGVCILGQQPVTGTDIGGQHKSDLVSTANPYLPNARSELVLPLISRGDVLGAMTIQSDEMAYFSEEDTTVFLTLADQLANAIANARLYEGSQTNLDELRRMQQRYALGMWEEYLERQVDAESVIGYTYDLNEVSPLMAFEQRDLPELTPGPSGNGVDGRAPIAQRGIEGGDGATLLQALQIRGEPVGLMSFEEPGAVVDWSDDQVMVLDAVREQLELALENRLLIDRSQRALREARQREAELGFLQEVSALLNATSDIVAAQDELLVRLQRFMAINHVALVAYSNTDRQFTLLGERGIDHGPVYAVHGLAFAEGAQEATAIEDQEAAAFARNAAREDSAFRQVVMRREGVTQDDLRLSTQFAEDEPLANAGIYSRALLPLSLGDRILGVLELGSAQVNAFGRSGLMPILEQVAAQVASAMERGSLLRAAQASAGESRRLYEATSDLAEAMDAPSVLQAIVQHAFPDTPARAEIGVYVTDPETGAADAWLEIAAGQVCGSALGEATDGPAAPEGDGVAPSAPVGTRVRVSEIPAVELLGSEQLFACEDVATDGRLDKATRAAYLAAGVRALVVAALSTGPTERTGILQVRFSAPRHFTEQDRRLYHTVSDQAAVVLSNRRLYQESQGRIARQAVAVELAALTTSLSERGPLLQASVDFLADRFDLYFAGIFLLDDQGQWAVLQAGTGDAGERLLMMGHRVQVGWGTTVGRCARLGQRILLLDTDNATALLQNPLLPDTRSMAVFPLISRGQTTGVVALHSRARFAFSQEDIATLELMVNQLANVIESTNLYERSQSSLAETRMLYRIAQQITDARDAPSVLKAAVEGIAQRSEPDWIIAGLLEPQEAPTSLQIAVSWSRGGSDFPVEVFPMDKVRQFSDVLRLDERFVTPDITQDPLVGDPMIRRIYSDLGLRATAAFQLKVRGTQYGTIMVHSHNAREFSTAELSFYENVARQAFVALENISLVDTTRQEAERRDLLNQVLQTASSSLERDTVLRDVGEVVARRLDMPVLMWAWDGAAALPIAVHDAGGRPILDLDPSAFSVDLVASMYDVVDRSQPLAIALGANGDGRSTGLGLRAALLDAYAMPLLSRDVVYGVMVLARQEGHDPIDESERAFLHTVGANLGVALETVSLYRDAQETATKLREVDELKNQFMANMSHELRTPLNSIIGFSRVMLKGIDGPLTDMQQTDLNAIYDSGRHLLNLINDILDISKINAGKMEIVFESVDLKAMVQSVMSTALGFVKDKPIKLQTDVPDDLPMVVADGRRIRQVLTNLLGNAGKFTESGFIRVSATYDDYQVILSVQDSGIGIPEDRIHAVFEQFEQVDSSSTRRYGGTGLGVPLSREFVRMHGGDMWIQETIVGEGTTFSFSLPIGGPEAARREEQAESGSAAKVVLTVDDDEGVITLFRRYLEKQGYRVFGLTRGDRVVDEAKRLKPYAITLDVIMPGKNGWDVIRELKSDPATRDIPVIVCSILGDRDKALSMGIADYLVKPISEELLLQALSRVIRIHEGEDAQEKTQVLVVDDNPDDRKLLRRILQDAAYEVTEAEGGSAAIDRIHAEAPNLIVLDLMMPDVDGFAVLEHLKGEKATRQIPVIVVTAKELGSEERAQLQERVEALLEKGIFDQQQLLADVSSALDRLAASRDA